MFIPYTPLVNTSLFSVEYFRRYNAIRVYPVQRMCTLRDVSERYEHFTLKKYMLRIIKFMIHFVRVLHKRIHHIRPVYYC